MISQNEAYIDVMWHHLWFQAMNATGGPRENDGPITDEEAEVYDLTDPKERAEFDAWEASRDRVAEWERHQTTFLAIRDAMAHWGLDLPDEPEEFLGFETYEQWRERHG